MAMSSCLGSAALFRTADGARISRKRADVGTEALTTKFISGVPVVNYQAAFEGEAILGEVAKTEGEWVVIVNPGTTDEQIQTMCKAASRGCKLTGSPSAGGVPFLEMRGTEADLAAVIHSAPSAVKFIEPDQTVEMIPEIEADVEASTWGLNRIAADQRSRTGGEATIFVLDTGVRVSHTEFQGRAVPALDLTSGSLVECNGDLTCAGDRQGHGTHCAGTAAGETYGVAPGAAVRSIKVLSDSGSGSWSWSYQALDWMAKSEIRPAIASMSLGGSGTQQAMREAVDAAVNSGVTVVVAGGNSNSDACRFSPAFVPSAITVGSTTSSDQRSSFSNYGSCTNIWAPGSNVVSASHTSDDGSKSLSGTSMACPHVSGAAALIQSADQTMKPSAVLQEMLNTAYQNELSGLKFDDTNSLLCVAEGGAPQPVPTPAPAPGTWVVSGSGCAIAGECISSNNHPQEYGNSEECSIRLFGDIDLSFEAFDTESRYDKLTVGGTQYSGTTGPQNGAYTGLISWSSDRSITKSGWKFCRA